MFVVCLNGSINSGKSTIGRALAQILPNAEFVEGDDHGIPEGTDFHEMIDRAIDRLLRFIHQSQQDFLVISYPLRHEDFVRLQEAARQREATLFVATLAPPLDVTLSNRGARLLSKDERTRIREMYAEGYADRDFSDIFITKAESPSVISRSIAEAVLRKVEREQNPKL